MLRGLFIADIRAMAEGNITNVFVEAVLIRVTVPVGFVGAHRVLIPFAGENALPADRLKAAADPADTGKQIDEPESIMGMVGRRWRQQRCQTGILIGRNTAAARSTVATRLRSPGSSAIANGQQKCHQRFHIVYCHQLAQQRLSLFPGRFRRQQQALFLR
jgi:hypothetical protein